jgi:CBS domain-containing protein
MAVRLVKDVMLPLDDVPIIRDDATLAEAVRALQQAQQHRPAGRLPYRVVLVVNRDGQVLGAPGPRPPAVAMRS